MHMSSTRTMPDGRREVRHGGGLPESYGYWETMHRRFSRWYHAGV